MGRSEIIRNGLAIIVVWLALWLTEVYCPGAILLPSVASMAIGLLVIDKRVWEVGKLQMVVAVALAAFCGVFITSRLADVGFGLRLLVDFCCAGLVLLVTCCRFLPAFSACILPVILDITSWDYVVLATSSTAVIGVLMWVLELLGLRRYRSPLIACPTNYGVMDVRLWGVMICCLVPLTLIAGLTGWHYMLAPAVMATMLEFVNASSGFTRRPWQVLFMMTFMACASVIIRMISDDLGLSASTMAVVMMIGGIMMFVVFRKYYASAVAIGLLALIIPEGDVMTYGIQIGLGTAYAILASFIPYLIMTKENDE